MSKTTVNLTSNIVNQEVQKFLENYPMGHPYRTIFSLSYFRQKLIANILDQISDHHEVIGDIQNLMTNKDDSLASLAAERQIKILIKEKISEILSSNYQQVGAELAKEHERLELMWLW